MDKTGTITQGKPVVTDLAPTNGKTEEELLRLAASLEKRSEHPLGRAIVDEAERRQMLLLSVDDFTQVPGQGITGRISGHECLAGNRKLMQAHDIDTPTISQFQDTLAEQGKTPLFFAKDGILCGMIAVADIVKPTSRDAVQELQNMGIDVVMLTGDHAKTAEAIRQQVGASRAIAEVLPQDKILHIEGMMCQHCVRNVTQALESIDGAQNVHVDLDNHSAELDLPIGVSDDTLTQVITDADYELKSIETSAPAAMQHKRIDIEGMMCQHCVATVTRILENIDGAQNVRVDLDSHSAELYLPADASDDTLVQLITEADYEVRGITTA